MASNSDDRKPYSDAVSTGQYAKKSGLSGKYDNVRQRWEDTVTRLFFRPYLRDLIEQKKKKLERLNILDLGCGAGDGYHLLMGTTAKNRGIYEYSVELIDKKMIGFYLGLDINKDLLAQASSLYGGDDKIKFEEGDFSGGLPIKSKEFDIYFTSYGTFSHNHDHQTVGLLKDIAENASNGALIIGDWLGRYSYEWQDRWSKVTDEEHFLDYRISYIYPPEQRKKVKIDSFPLRLMARSEIERIVKQAEKESGVKIEIKELFDRSIFVGRHMDTGDYNHNCKALRKPINSLMEPNNRTNLNSLFIDYHPKEGFEELNGFFENFSMAWNALVNHTVQFLSHFQSGKEIIHEGDAQLKFYPKPLREAVGTMRKVVNTAGDLPGDSRANIIEPQLAYALRKLEIELQPHWGVGHGFTGILQINK